VVWAVPAAAGRLTSVLARSDGVERAAEAPSPGGSVGVGPPAGRTF
jgi:hypothetical protein